MSAGRSLQLVEARVAIASNDEPGQAGYAAYKDLVVRAIETGGGRVVDAGDANALVWVSVGGTDKLAAILDANPGITWVQLPWAGVDSFVGTPAYERSVQFTCAKGKYGPIVGEHAFMLLLALARNVVKHARTKSWCVEQPELLAGKRVTVLGGGDLTQTLLRYLKTAEAQVTVINRSGNPVGDVKTLDVSHLHDVLPATDALVLTLALTPETEGIIGARELDLMGSGAWIVNVARGKHIDTDALVAALDRGHIAAAGLDVTEPEPLPDGHPLWQMDNVLITSHCANSVSYAVEALCDRVADNVRRFVAGQSLTGVVDPKAKY